MRYFKDENNNIYALDETQEHNIDWVEIQKEDISDIIKKRVDLSKIKELKIKAIKADFETSINDKIAVKGVGVINSGDEAIKSVDELLFVLKEGEAIDFLLADNITTIKADKKTLENIKKSLILDKIKKRKKKWELRLKAQNAKTLQDLDF